MFLESNNICCLLTFSDRGYIEVLIPTQRKSRSADRDSTPGAVLVAGTDTPDILTGWPVSLALSFVRYAVRSSTVLDIFDEGNDVCHSQRIAGIHVDEVMIQLLYRFCFITCPGSVFSRMMVSRMTSSCRMVSENTDPLLGRSDDEDNQSLLTAVPKSSFTLMFMSAVTRPSNSE